jgi:hypothetical protein
MLKTLPAMLEVPIIHAPKDGNALRGRLGSATELIFRLSVNTSRNAKREPSSYLWGESRAPDLELNRSLRRPVNEVQIYILRLG